LKTFPQPENFLRKLHLLVGNFHVLIFSLYLIIINKKNIFYRKDRKLHLLYEIFKLVQVFNFKFFNFYYYKQYLLLYIRDRKGKLGPCKEKVHTVYRVLTNGKKSVKLSIMTFAHCSTCCLFYSSHSLGPELRYDIWSRARGSE